MTELATLLTFARDIALRAGEITLQHFQQEIAVERKPDQSPVTVADRETEAFLRDAIGKQYPDHAILGEEEGQSGDSGATFRWILDPIDGTKSFVRGVPLYGVMVGLQREGEPVLGVVNIPALGEIVYAAQGQGCFWNGKPCRVSTVATLAESLVVGTSADNYRPYGKEVAFTRLIGAASLFRTWGDCYGYVLVATGRAEVALDPAMNIWDAAALLPILQEAGGSYTDWRGTPTIEANEGIGTNGHVLAEVLQLIGAGESA